MRLNDLLLALGLELQKHGARDIGILLDSKTLEAVNVALFHEGGHRWISDIDFRPDAAMRFELPRGAIIITAPERVIGRFQKPPPRRGKCEHGIPADYCTPCEVSR